MRGIARRLRDWRWIGAAMLCFVCAPAPAEQSFSLFQPTTEDVAPGVDHGRLPVFRHGVGEILRYRKIGVGVPGYVL